MGCVSTITVHDSWWPAIVCLQRLQKENKALAKELTDAHHQHQQDIHRLSVQLQQLQAHAGHDAAEAAKGAADKISALQKELAASKAAALKLEQELTSHQYRLEVRH